MAKKVTMAQIASDLKFISMCGCVRVSLLMTVLGVAKFYSSGHFIHWRESQSKKNIGSRIITPITSKILPIILSHFERDPISNARLFIGTTLTEANPITIECKFTTYYSVNNLQSSHAHIYSPPFRLIASS